MSDYTPSVAEIVMGKTHLGDNFWRELSEAEVRRGVEAVRAEEREKAAQVAEEFDPAEAALAGRYAGKDIATRIREQGKEQDRG